MGVEIKIQDAVHTVQNGVVVPLETQPGICFTHIIKLQK